MATLIVTLVKTAKGLKALVSTLQGFVAGRNRTIRIEEDGDVLEINGVSSSTEDQLVARVGRSTHQQVVGCRLAEARFYRN